MAARTSARERYSFANLNEVLELPDLIAIQRASFEWFLNQGLAETFRDISPIKDFSETLQLELEFDPQYVEHIEVRHAPADPAPVAPHVRDLVDAMLDRLQSASTDLRP